MTFHDQRLNSMTFQAWKLPNTKFHDFPGFPRPVRTQDTYCSKTWKSMLGYGSRGGLMVSALVSRSSGRVRALAGVIALCSWARHFTLTVPLSTQVYEWVLVNLILEVTMRCTSIPSRGSRNTPSRFMLQKPG